MRSNRCEKKTESRRNVLSHTGRRRVAIERSDRSRLWDRRKEVCLRAPSPSLALAADDPTDEAIEAYHERIPAEYEETSATRERDRREFTERLAKGAI